MSGSVGVRGSFKRARSPITRLEVHQRCSTTTCCGPAMPQCGHASKQRRAADMSAQHSVLCRQSLHDLRAQILYLTDLEHWSPHAVYQATRLFVSNLNAKLVCRPYLAARTLTPASFGAAARGFSGAGAAAWGYMVAVAAAADCVICCRLVRLRVEDPNKPIRCRPWGVWSKVSASCRVVCLVAQAQRFMATVLLPHVRQDIRANRRLHFALFQALKKATYKPDAFYKVRRAQCVDGVLCRGLPWVHQAAGRSACIVVFPPTEELTSNARITPAAHFMRGAQLRCDPGRDSRSRIVGEHCGLRRSCCVRRDPQNRTHAQRLRSRC